MANNGKIERKGWVAPELKKISAGSAEARQAQIADGGNPNTNNDRS